MRRARFFELLSAYIDGELSAGEEALVRDEIRKKPAYAARLSDYIRMNAAVKTVRFPKEEKRIVPGTSVATTVLWCLTGVAAGITAVLAVMAAANNPPVMPTPSSNADYCELGGNYTVTVDAGNAMEAHASLSRKPASTDMFELAKSTRESLSSLKNTPMADEGVFSSTGSLDAKSASANLSLIQRKLPINLQQECGTLCIPISYRP